MKVTLLVWSTHWIVCDCVAPGRATIVLTSLWSSTELLAPGWEAFHHNLWRWVKLDKLVRVDQEKLVRNDHVLLVRVDHNILVGADLIPSVWVESPLISLKVPWIQDHPDCGWMFDQVFPSFVETKIVLAVVLVVVLFCRMLVCVDSRMMIVVDGNRKLLNQQRQQTKGENTRLLWFPSVFYIFYFFFCSIFTIALILLPLALHVRRPQRQVVSQQLHN